MMNLADNLSALILSCRQAVLPPLRITVSEWADLYRVLPETANQPGRYHTDTTPWIREPQDSFSDPRVEEITMQKSAQSAGTTMIENIMGYNIDIDPWPMLYMSPTVETSRTFSSEKFDPMIADSPTLRGKVLKKHNKDKENTNLLKRYPGGFVKFVGGNSPNTLRQMSIPIVISDDIDSIEIGAVKEGDPVLRAEKRSQTFEGRKKKVRVSTPTRKGLSRINKFFQSGSRKYWYVTCLSCGHKQVLKLENIHWEKDVDLYGKPIKHYPETAQIACISCGVLHTEAERREMIARGEWIAENPNEIRHQSFKFDEISSTLSTLQNVVSQYIQALDDPEKMEVFTNLVLGDVYSSQEVVSVDYDQLVTRVERYNTEEDPGIPAKVLLLTAGVDVQQDRLEAQILGWGKGEECWVVAYYRIYGDTDKDEVYDELDQLLYSSEWLREDGYILKITRMGIDSGFQGLNKKVYEYAFRHRHLGVFAIKGQGRYGAKLWQFTKAFNKLIDVVHIGTNEAKATIFEKRLGITEHGPRCIHFSEEICDVEYFAQLTSEHGVKKSVGMMTITVYEKKSPKLRNEALDTFIYAYVMMVIMMPNWDAVERNIKIQIEQKRNIRPVTHKEVTASARPAEPEPKQPAPQTITRAPNRPRTGGWVSNWRR